MKAEAVVKFFEVELIINFFEKVFLVNFFHNEDIWRYRVILKVLLK